MKRNKRKPKVKRNCQHCGEVFDVWQSRIGIGKGKFCSISCGQKGKNNNFWKGGVTYRDGYRVVYAPEHPNSSSRNRILEHRMIMSNYLGRPLKDEEVVHHKNGIRDDNRIENLELLDNQSDHYSLHMTGNKIWLGKKHKPETIEKMKKSWTRDRKMKQKVMSMGKNNSNYRHGRYVIPGERGAESA